MSHSNDSMQRDGNPGPVRWSLAAAAWLVLATTPAAAEPIGIATLDDMGFGRFAAGSGGTVVVSTSGSLSVTGGVVLPASSIGAAARFTVSGDPSFIYAITLPLDDTVNLASGGHSMAVRSFTSEPSGNGQLGTGGTQVLSVGATLVVAAGQAPGSYSASFTVTVDYN